MIPEWRLQMMANHIFRKYLSEKDKVLALANSMLEAHIGDFETEEDNSQLIITKRSELELLNRKLDNYIEMRSEGDISKELFRTKSNEIQSRIEKLKNEITELEEKSKNTDIADCKEKLTILQYALEQYTKYDDNDVPPFVIEAFVSKIVASKDGFDWYLRFDGNPDDPLHCTAKGKRKVSTEICVAGENPPAMHIGNTGCNQG